MIELALLGGGGHASDILGLIERLRELGESFDVLIGDDRWDRPDRFEGRDATLVSIDQIIESGRNFIAATGFAVSRRPLAARAVNAGLSPAPALVHPTVETHGVEIGDGSVVLGLSWISPLAEVGHHSYVGYGAKIGHDVVISDYVSVMPGAFVGGDVTVGDGALIGANATVIQGLTIGEGAEVGAGSVVTTDVPPGVTVVGVPARPLEQK